MPAAATRIRTSVGPISGTGTSAFSSGLRTFVSRTALMQYVYLRHWKEEMRSVVLRSCSPKRFYFFPTAPGSDEDAGCAGKSELNMSIPTFHFPSAFFCHTSQYLPLSLLPSFIVISYVPVKTAMSPDFATSTRVVFQLMSIKVSRNPFQRFRIFNAGDYSTVMTTF